MDKNWTNRGKCNNKPKYKLCDLTGNQPWKGGGKGQGWGGIWSVKYHNESISENYVSHKTLITYTDLQISS